MGWRAPVNCIHLDNYRRCRVHTAPIWIRWLLPKGRPLCILELPEPQDGALTCPDQVKGPRPPQPPPMRPK